MESHHHVYVGCLLILMGFICTSNAYTFHVGGKQGWILKPTESYSHWAERNRFQVNDTLVFKYKKRHNSVLLVNQDDYNNCNKSNSIQTLDDIEGHSEFMFDRSGPFFFISGHGHYCHKGQKLVILVMAVRNKPSHSPSPAPSVIPSPSPESPPEPGYHAPAPSLEPGYHAPAPSPRSTAPALGSCSFGLFLGLSLVLGSFVGLL